MWWLPHTLYNLSIEIGINYLDAHQISINYEENIIYNNITYRNATNKLRRKEWILYRK